MNDNIETIPLPIGLILDLFIKGKIDINECSEIINDILRFAVRMEIKYIEYGKDLNV